MWSAVLIYTFFLVGALDLGGGNASPLREKFIVHSSEMTPHEGQTVTLSCFIGGPLPPPIPSPSSYEWIKDGKVIPGQTGHTLTMERLTSQDEGDYQCGPPHWDVPREVFHLDVIRGERSPLHETIFYVDKYGSNLLGRTLRLRCYFFGPLIVKPSSYVWAKDGKVIPGAIERDVHFQSLSSSDTGDYQCADPSMDVPRRNFHLNVITTLPTPIVYKDRLPVCDYPFSLNCIIMAGYSTTADTAYTWYKDSVEIKGQTGQVLRFDNVTEADTGKYTCTARDGPMDTTSAQSQAFDLDPLMKPQICIKPTNPSHLVKGIMGEKLTLTCEVIRSNPIVPYNGYSWSFLPSHREQLRPLVGTSRKLTLGPLTRADSGQYVCQAKNDQNFETVTLVGQDAVTLDIVYLENISLTTDVTVNESDEVVLICKVNSHPIAHLIWTVKGEVVRHVVDNVDHYVITKAACTDSASYTCRANNADLPDLEISATSHLLVNCNQELKKSERPGIIQANVAAPFDITLPEETSVVVVHPSGQSIIIVQKNCSYTVSSAFISRCLETHCDPESHHLTFILTHVTEKDEGLYFCVDVKYRKPVPDCNQTLVFDRNELDVTNSGTPVWWIIAAFAAAAWIATGLGLIIWQRRRLLKSFTRLKRNAWSEIFCLTFWRELFTRTEKEHGSHTFENLYEKGNVYVFPQLVAPEQQTSALTEEEADELTCLLQNSEIAEFTVKNLVKNVLIKLTGNDSLPSFLLHNTCLSRAENFVLILSRKLGVVLMIINPAKDLADMQSIQTAVNHLLETRKFVQKRLAGLANPSRITATIALPHLSHKDMDGLGKLKQNVEILFGLELEDFQQWAERLSRRSDTDVWNLNRNGLDNPDTAFTMAASRFLTLAGNRHPGEPPKRLTEAESWLLTSDQMKVRDSEAKMLHVWGSPGSGKTSLLIHRARHWLAEGKAVVLAVGREVYDVLLAYVIREVLRDQRNQTRRRIRVCRVHSKLQLTLKELQAQHPENDICLVIDTLRDAELFQNAIKAIRIKQVSSVWSVCRDSLPIIDQKLSKEAHELGWVSLKLPDSIRCTENTVELLNKLGKGSHIHYPILARNVPRDRDIPKWKVVDHCFHQSQTITALNCHYCKSDLSPAMALPGQNPCWSDWLAIYTGNPNVIPDIKPICKTLQSYGIPATLDSHYEVVASHGAHLDSSETDMTRWLERVVAGEDEEGSPTVHMVPVRDLAGMEKEGVLLVHWDERDNDPKCQSAEARQTRLEEHRYLWILAVSRSKSQVILLLLTPSPARSLLGLAEAVMPAD